MKDMITIGLPSKGRLKEKSISFFNDRGLKIIQSEKERNYFGTVENKPNVKIIFLHAKEIIQRLGDGTLDIGISGLDLLKESDKNLQSKINIQKKLDYGNANLVIAVPDDWIDVQTIADLEEVSFDIRSKRNFRYWCIRSGSFKRVRQKSTRQNKYPKKTGFWKREPSDCCTR